MAGVLLVETLVVEIKELVAGVLEVELEAELEAAEVVVLKE